MIKLLVLGGPTATGKTALALGLAKKYNAELISADSRQVYRGMDIGTGKDVPAKVKCQMSNVKCDGRKICFYMVNEVKIWGYDLVDPKEEFSVSQYVKIANKIISVIEKKGKLPILVGGTGFYIKGVIDKIATLEIPKNKNLRGFLATKSTTELFNQLAQLAPVRAASMNTSDRNNPRRLIRAIEIAISKLKVQKPKLKTKRNILFIGLTAPSGFLNKKIEMRVDMRLKKGFEKELRGLVKNGVTWKNQSMSSLGYSQWAPYISYLLSPPKATQLLAGHRGRESTGQEIKRKVIEEWKKEEKKYKNRQKTWFKKDKRIKWFDVNNSGWKNRVEKTVQKWYKTE